MRPATTCSSASPPSWRRRPSATGATSRASVPTSCCSCWMVRARPKALAATGRIRKALESVSVQFGESEQLPGDRERGDRRLPDRRGRGDRAPLRRHDRAGGGEGERRRYGLHLRGTRRRSCRHRELRRAAGACHRGRHEGPLHQAALRGRGALRGVPRAAPRDGRGHATDDPPGGPPPRRRQDRDPGRPPPQAVEADCGGVRDLPAACRARRRDRPRRAERRRGARGDQVSTTSDGMARGMSKGSRATAFRSSAASSPWPTPSAP